MPDILALVCVLRSGFRSHTSGPNSQAACQNCITTATPVEARCDITVGFHYWQSLFAPTSTDAGAAAEAILLRDGQSDEASSSAVARVIGGEIRTAAVTPDSSRP